MKVADLIFAVRQFDQRMPSAPWSTPGNSNVIGADGEFLFSVPRGKGDGASARRNATVGGVCAMRAAAPALADAVERRDEVINVLCEWIDELYVAGIDYAASERMKSMGISLVYGKWRIEE